MAVNAALGGAVKRREDRRLVTGAGRFTDDVQPEVCLHAVFVRSTLAHARIKAIDTAEAGAMPGVVAIFGAADLAFETFTPRPRLASDMVRYVGDAIAIVIGETREDAVDAAAAVAVDYEQLPAIIDSTAALAPGAALVYADRDDNLILDFEIGEPGALDGADVSILSLIHISE